MFLSTQKVWLALSNKKDPFVDEKALTGIQVASVSGLKKNDSTY